MRERQPADAPEPPREARPPLFYPPRPSIRTLALLGALLGALAGCPAETAAPADTAEPPADTAEPPADTAQPDTALADTTPGEDTIRVQDTRVGDARPDTDGPATTCGDADDCVMCPFGRPPATHSACVCPACPTFAVTAELCAFAIDAWGTRCEGRDADGADCPRLECPEPGPVACEDTVCVASCPGVTCPALSCEAKEQVLLPGACCAACPGVCADAADCVGCWLERAPTSEDDCGCPECPAHPLPAVDCAGLEAAFDAVCGAWALAKGCEAPSCPPPQPLVCDDLICGFGGAR